MDGEHGAGNPFKWAAASDGCCNLLKTWQEGGTGQPRDGVNRQHLPPALSISRSGIAPAVIWLPQGNSFLAHGIGSASAHRLLVLETQC
jgi:hypothetical protein